jgi:hypothetical protein
MFKKTKAHSPSMSDPKSFAPAHDGAEGHLHFDLCQTEGMHGESVAKNYSVSSRYIFAMHKVSIIRDTKRLPSSAHGVFDYIRFVSNSPQMHLVSLEK